MLELKIEELPANLKSGLLEILSDFNHHPAY